MTLFQALEDDWKLLAQSTRAAQVVQRWSQGDLARFRAPQEIVDHLQHRGRPQAHDEVLRPLLERAKAEQLAARIALQAFLPGIKAVVRRYSWADDRAELESCATTGAYERIRSYPLNRRPDRIAANVMADTKRVLYDRYSKQRAVEVLTSESGDTHPVAHATTTAAERAIKAIGQAVQGNLLSPADGQLIIATRVFDEPIESLTTQHGLNAQSLRRRRLRAEARLASVESMGIDFTVDWTP